MAIVTTFFDGGGISYTAAKLMAAWASIQSDGVIGSADYLVYEKSPADLSVNVALGAAFRGGYYIKSDAVENVAITANTSGYSRIDLIALDINTTTKATTAIAVAGTPSSSPVAPTPTATQLQLAHVLVGNGASVINNNVITNMRAWAIHKSVSNPNLLINGNFDFWQRAITQTSSAMGSDDRWRNFNVGTTKTHTQQAFTVGQTAVPNNPVYYSRTVVTSAAGAGNHCYKGQRVEDVTATSRQFVTLSFWAKADANKNIAVEFIQNFGSGGSADVNTLGSQLVALTTAWQKFEITVALPSVSGKTIGADNYTEARFWLDAGSTFATRTASLGQQSGTFEIAQVKLELGSAATAFVPRQLADEIALCKRFFEKSYNLAVAPGTNTQAGSIIELAARNAASSTEGTRFSVTKRGAVTVTLYAIDGTINSITNTTAKAATVNNVGQSGIQYISITSGGDAAASAAWHFTAESEL